MSRVIRIAEFKTNADRIAHFKKSAKMLRHEGKYSGNDYNMAMADVCDQIADDLEELEARRNGTFDIEPVGVWKYDYDESMSLLSRGWICPRCARRQTFGQTAFCPRCGARVGRGDEE